MDVETDKRDAWTALARFLVKLNLIDSAAFERHFTVTASLAGGPLAYGSSLNLFDERDALELIAQRLGISAITVHRHSIDTFAASVDSSLLQKLPLEQWKEFRAMPTKGPRGELVVVMANPLDQAAKKKIDFTLGESGRLAIGAESDILTVLARKLSLAGEQSVSEFLELPPELPSLSSPGQLESVITTTSDVEAAPIVRIVNRIFVEALERGASDIHLLPERDTLDVRVRVDGVLVPLMLVPAQLTAGVTSRVKLLAGMDISERRHPQDGRIRLTLSHHHRDLRVSTVPTLHGEKIVARILNSDATNVSFESLGVPLDVREKIARDLSGSSQVLLVTGPTGSGKTSSLYAGIMLLRDGETNIVTIEDPIEYRVDGITQIQANNRNGMSFAEALRSVLRQDPDVVVVGEIRDLETATTAMQVAQTGHLVVATLHTNSAAAAITRLADIGIPPYIIASSIKGVLAQRLVRKVCAACGGRQDEMDECAVCHGSGFSGRTGVFSYLQVSQEVRNAIRAGASEQELERIGRQEGFRTLSEDAQRLVADGLSTESEVRRVIGIEDPPSAPLPSIHDEAARSTPSVRRDESSSPHAAAPKTVAAPHKRRLLLVEDDENMRLILAMLFERAMFEVIQADDGAAALEQVYTCVPDIIVCDLMMPGIDGAETVKILRRDPATREIPVLMLTAANTEENELALLQAGADDFVSKTSNKQILLSRVENLLSRRAM